MTPELEVELERIGWRTASANPWRKLQYERVLRKDAGMVAPNPKEAKAALIRHRKLCKAISDAVEGMRAFSEDEATSINLGSTPVDERNGGWPDHISVAATALEQLAPGLHQWKEFLEHEIGKSRRGGRKNEPAYRIAATLAEIHVIGLGKMPTIGRREDGKGPSGLFCQVAASVFSLLGLEVADVVRPCKAAKDGLTKERVRELLDERVNLGPFPGFRMAQIPSVF